MGFKFAGISPRNFAKNHSTAVTVGPIVVPSCTWWTAAYIHRARYLFQLFSKLGHTRRNQWRAVTFAMDRYWGLVASLMKRTQPDPAGFFLKILTFKKPTPSFHLFPSLFLPFSTSNFLPLIQPIIFPNSKLPKIHSLLVGVCCCGSLLDHQVTSSLVFLKFSGMCFWFYQFTLHFCLSISISWFLIDGFIL